MPLISKNITFNKQLYGYDRAQVDLYLAELARAYQEAYDEYKSEHDKNNNLLDEIGELKERINSTPKNNLVTKEITDSQLPAQIKSEETKTKSGNFTIKVSIRR